MAERSSVTRGREVGRMERPTRACPLCTVCEIQEEAKPESWTGLACRIVVLASLIYVASHSQINAISAVYEVRLTLHKILSNTEKIDNALHKHRSVLFDAHNRSCTVTKGARKIRDMLFGKLSCDFQCRAKYTGPSKAIPFPFTNGVIAVHDGPAQFIDRSARPLTSIASTVERPEVDWLPWEPRRGITRLILWCPEWCPLIDYSGHIGSVGTRPDDCK